jgi:hypothetical protein
MDKQTNGFYMPPDDVKFYAYSEPGRCLSKPPNTRLTETEYESEAEIKTAMFAEGFTRGFIDDVPATIREDELLTFYRNRNDISYCQYLLTKKKAYVDQIHPTKLYTLCRIDDGQALFPCVREDGKVYVLAYTSRGRMSRELFEKYENYHPVRVTFDTDLIVNDRITL